MSDSALLDSLTGWSDICSLFESKISLREFHWLEERARKQQGRGELLSPEQEAYHSTMLEEHRKEQERTG